VKRNPVVSAAVGVALVAVVVFALVVPWVLAKKEKENAALLTIERDRAVAARKEAESEKERAFAAQKQAALEKDRAISAEAESDRQRGIAEKQARISEERARVIQKNYDQIIRLSDMKRYSELEADADALWPAYPENISLFKEWLKRSDEVLGRLEEHKQTLASLRESVLPYGDAEARKDRETHPQWETLQKLRDAKTKLEEQMASLEAGSTTGEEEKSSTDSQDLGERLASLDARISELKENVYERRTWVFEDTETQWQHDMVAGLVSGLEGLADEEEGLVKSVRERLVFASTIEAMSVVDHQAAWDEAIASIADEGACPQYRGLALEPMIGFVPVGQDPDSGLFEFAHLQTGEIPRRDSEGKLLLEENTGLVFVLIPGGSFNMGAVTPSEVHPEGSPNVAPQAQSDEVPVHEVVLKPFFLSKYEVTQGQWTRFAGENPSNYKPGNTLGGKKVSLLHPVEQVSWDDCRQWLSRLHLRLPSEAEWEYGARAGTDTGWWTGNRKESLAGAANLADLFCRNNGGPAGWPYEEWLDDGYTAHSIVGLYRPNHFGLHDITGNVQEWCEDYYHKNYVGAPIDGSAWVDGGYSSRVCRGGNWVNVSDICRSAYRDRFVPGMRYYYLGLRPARSLQN